jgi:hypothetical protein
LKEVEAVARRYGCNGLPAYFRLEQARLFAEQAIQDLKQRHFFTMLNSLAKCVATVFTSWVATKSLFNPHVWRNYRTAQLLYRHVELSNPERP